MIEKVLDSAIANANDQRTGRPEMLMVIDIRVDSGPMQRRWRPKARGSSMVYHKRSSHISIELG